MHKNILDEHNCVLLIIDIQEKFKDIIQDAEVVIKNMSRLIKAANILKIPVIYTEQYPQGIGPTVEVLKEDLASASYFEKIYFSCCKDNNFMGHLKLLNKKQVLVCGVETHICVNKTVHDLLEAGYSAHVIRDAVSSRSELNLQVGIDKMRDSGAIISCVEMALFEIMMHSKHEKFKEVQKLII